MILSTDEIYRGKLGVVPSLATIGLFRSAKGDDDAGHFMELNYRSSQYGFGNIAADFHGSASSLPDLPRIYGSAAVIIDNTASWACLVRR